MPVQRLTWALALVGVYMICEIVGGLLSGSLALLADAGHMAVDAGALGLSLWAARIRQRGPTAKHTYGFHRAEILVALLNGGILVGAVVWIFYHALQRLATPSPIEGGLMMGVAAGGLMVNLVAAYLLHREREHNLNIKGAWLHVLGDLLGSIGALLAGGAILLWNARWADPVASMVIGALILYGAVRLVSQAVNVLMAGVPEQLDQDHIQEALLELDGVEGLHDFHLWMLTPNFPLLTAHLHLHPEASPDAILKQAGRILEEQFGIEHATLQMEPHPKTHCPTCQNV